MALLVSDEETTQLTPIPRGYVVKINPWFFVGLTGLVSSERRARTFSSVGAAHTAMKGSEHARRGYSVVPLTH